MRTGSPGITGTITEIEVPATLKAGDKIQVKLDADLYNPDYSWYDFWAGCLTVEQIGYRDYDVFGGNGKVIGPDPSPTIVAGFMPGSSITLSIKLWGNPDYWASWDWSGADWVLADSVSRTIALIGGPECECDLDCVELYGSEYHCEGGKCVDSGGNPPPLPEEGFNWKWVALGGGVAIAAIILFRR